MKKLALLVPFFAICIACGPKEPPAPKVEVVYVERPAPVPEGAVRYCWEEPVVKYEKKGPGLNMEGTWYYPSHTAVREIRMGKWRPCKQQKSESIGGRYR